MRMDKATKDHDTDGNPFWYHWEGDRGYFIFSVKLSQILLASVIGKPFSKLVRCEGKY